MRLTPVRAVAVLLVFLLVLGAAGVAFQALHSSSSSSSDDGTSSGDGPLASLAPTPDPQPGSEEPPTPDLASFYGQSIDWKLCRGDEFECGTITVPVDYTDPTGETFELNLLKAPARQQGARLGSLVVNPGGPGAPGTDYAAQAAFAFRSPIRDHFDIVGFDPRGTGASDPVDCLTDSELDAFLAGDQDPETAQEGQAYEQRQEDFFAGCSQRTGDILSHVTTVEAAQDMDVLRSALGEQQLTYFGASYGTKLGATYADLFPANVGRFVLDGAVDVSLGNRELTLQQAAGFETAIRSYVQNCVDEGQADGDECYLGDDLEAGLATIKDFLAGVEETPLPTSDDERPLEVGNAFAGVVYPLYNRDYWTLIDTALPRALDGDGSLLLKVADLFLQRNSDGSYANNSNEAIYAINCLDDPASITADEIAAELPAFERASPTFGDSFAWQLASCHGIQVQAQPADVDKTVTATGAAPIVVIGTTRDPATPYRWAQALATQLDSGVLVTRDGDGHTGYNAGNECVDGAVEDYLVDGTVPQDGLQC